MNDVVIIDAVRTPIGRHAGALAGVRPDDMGALVIQALMERTVRSTQADIAWLDQLIAEERGSAPPAPEHRQLLGGTT